MKNVHFTGRLFCYTLSALLALTGVIMSFVVGNISAGCWALAAFLNVAVLILRDVQEQIATAYTRELVAASEASTKKLEEAYNLQKEKRMELYDKYIKVLDENLELMAEVIRLKSELESKEDK